MLRSYATTDIGQKRQLNQDFIYLSEGPIGNLPNVFIVADGMGGHNAGDFASRYAVETVAENFADGVLAPLFYMTIGGAPLALAYKAVNTMDSMIGYKNERYLQFGRAAAKLDDGANYLPARLAALLWIVAAPLVGQDAREAFRIWRRDRRNPPSPNSAQTESACAGALGIQLAGPAWYFGMLHEKPTIGDGCRPVEPEDILRANRALYAASILALLLCLGVRALVVILL